MAKKRKLQVFVSSTFTDLIVERQVAVEAILTARHIPAGMELFAGKNEEQMNIIKRWIDESDMYMLLLGGRYGSIDDASGISYTHLEYEYAKEANKTIFVVVAKEEFTKQKLRDLQKEDPNVSPGVVMEIDNRKQYLAFREAVTGKFVKHYDNLDALKLAVITTLYELEQDENLIGWVPGSESVDSGAIAQELARIGKENAVLRSQLSQVPKDGVLFNGLVFDDAAELLGRNELDLNEFRDGYRELITTVTQEFTQYGKPTTLHFLWLWYIFAPEYDFFSVGDSYLHSLLLQLQELHLVVEGTTGQGFGTYQYGNGRYGITSEGKKFLLRLKVRYNLSETYSIVSNFRISVASTETGFNPFE